MYEIQSHRKLLFDLSSFASPYIRRLYSNNKPIKENNSLPSIFFYLQIGELKFFSSLKISINLRNNSFEYLFKKISNHRIILWNKSKGQQFFYFVFIPFLLNRWEMKNLSFTKEKLHDTCAKKTNSVAFVYSKKKKKKKKSNILTLILLAFYGNYFPQRPLRSPPDVCC